MAYWQEVYDFAGQWRDRFRDYRMNQRDLAGQALGEACAALGFEMDGGQAFYAAYGEAATSYGALEGVIDEVVDISLLGAAIYARWQYFNQLADDPAAIELPQNRAWFILALGRLLTLAGGQPAPFRGHLKEMRLVSNRVAYGLLPGSCEEVEQVVTVDHEGGVSFAGYSYGHGPGSYEKARSRDFVIQQALTDALLCAMAAYFKRDPEGVFLTDSGSWDLTLTNTEDRVYLFKGSLGADLVYKEISLSDLLRKVLDMDDLYAFDGRGKPDLITRIALDYHRTRRLKAIAFPRDRSEKSLLQEETASLVIDKASGSLIFNQQTEGGRLSYRYEEGDAVSRLLESFEAERLFTAIEGNPADVIDDPDDSKTYAITLDYQKKPRRVIRGSYDKRGLPVDFAGFANCVSAFIRRQGLGDIFDPAVYGKVRRRRSDYIFCSVSFNYIGKDYYYLTDDDSIEAGDLVIVPAGEDNTKTLAEVQAVEYFSAEEAPFPLEKTKRIIRKCTDEEIDRYLEWDGEEE
ncbi:hypothetical protein ACKQTC_04100 [Peptococcus simiae]|uniref:Uncharacterized protein n=1 Tax=Peptococcus simiae TaxID=1643805 RepID=A0ABW9GY45_9FIRM